MIDEFHIWYTHAPFAFFDLCNTNKKPRWSHLQLANYVRRISDIWHLLLPLRIKKPFCNLNNKSWSWKERKQKSPKPTKITANEKKSPRTTKNHRERQKSPKMKQKSLKMKQKLPRMKKNEPRQLKCKVCLRMKSKQNHIFSKQCIEWRTNSPCWLLR